MNALLVDLAVKSAAILVCAIAVVAMMRRASAASRHAIWTGAFVALLLLPIARASLPEIQIPILAADSPPRVISQKSDEWLAPPVLDAPLLVSETPTFERPSERPAAPTPEPARSRRWTLALVVGVVWAIGASLVLARLVSGFLATRRLRRNAAQVPGGDERRILDLTRQRLGVRRSIELLRSPVDTMPMTWGVVRLTILLPNSAPTWEERSPQRLASVLAHECAHIARWDALSELVARIAVAMFWFNPLVWIALRQSRIERERACDDLVLALGERPSDYAEHLMELANGFADAPGLAMARRSQLERRISAILDAGVQRNRVSRTTLGAAMTMFATMVVASVISRPLMS